MLYGLVKILQKANKFVTNTNAFYWHFVRKSSLKSSKLPRMKCLWFCSSRRLELVFFEGRWWSMGRAFNVWKQTSISRRVITM